MMRRHRLSCFDENEFAFAWFEAFVCGKYDIM